MDGEDAEDGLLHRPLAAVVAMDELVVLEPLGQCFVSDELTLALLRLLIGAGAIASYAGTCRRRRSHGRFLSKLTTMQDARSLLLGDVSLQHRPLGFSKPWLVQQCPLAFLA